MRREARRCRRLGRLKFRPLLRPLGTLVTLAVTGARALAPPALPGGLYAATLTDCERVRLFAEPLPACCAVDHLPRASWGMVFAHPGWRW